MALGLKAPEHRSKARSAVKAVRAYVKSVEGKLDAGKCGEALHMLDNLHQEIGVARAHGRQSTKVDLALPVDKIRALEDRFRQTCMRKG